MRCRSREVRITALLLSLMTISLASRPAGAQTTDRLTFLGVSLDSGTRQADRMLLDYLSQRVGIRFTAEDLEYEQVIRRLVNWRAGDGLFVARVTPYAYVVSELLGANVEPLAVYSSATTGQTTYQSYFVVNRSNFAGQPTLLDLLRFITTRKERAKFVYQSQFSTSSYFLPSLFFRRNKIFEMRESTESLVAIETVHAVDAGSAKLVELVATGAADVAAVWDGVKSRFEQPGQEFEATGRKVYFIPLPTALPNDLLLCSTALGASAKDELRTAIASMTADAINVGDFRTWQTLAAASQAKLALADLRQTARERLSPITVDVQALPGAASPAPQYVEAARQAVRLAGTEFVLFDEDFHAHQDFSWTVEPIHDGAIVLHSAIPGSEVPPQAFQLSFRDLDDLTARIVNVVQLRLHRIRYVWPFSGAIPTVIRDNTVSLPVGAEVRAQRITWIDPERNDFRGGPVFSARIGHASFNRYELVRDDFVRALGPDVQFEPMSNVGFRIILLRSPDERWLFRALTITLVGLFSLAAAAAVWDLLRHRARPQARPAEPAR